MAFSHTSDAVRRREKTVTRRIGWHGITAGVVLNAVVKSRGRRPGEPIEHLARIQVVKVSRERLLEITQEDVAREGYPDWSPERFVDHFMQLTGCLRTSWVRRIEFKYLEEEPGR